ncbi:transient receptor potential cation channel subfamily A member 1-like isoform X1 [Lytechinus variegatus]|uniref:transient receptor potential cation channel subfamily A member 1-like isoform X1 n=1 Tax=Lytechinus variegatus TaxID=7654 RepID=UPI001BB0E120|nr:transient receptor potential cation channel subfamily A member 1-like isoform X1 [Lytechinus variegatus]
MMKRRSLGQILKANPKWNYLSGRTTPGDREDSNSCGNCSPSMEMNRKDFSGSMKKAKQSLKMLQSMYKNPHAKEDCVVEDMETAPDSWDANEGLKESVQLSFDEFLTGLNLDPERLHALDSKGASFLHHAAKAGRRDLVDYLVDRGLDINGVDEAGNTPLHWAVESGEAKIIDALIGIGARTNILNKLKMAPLHLACDINSVDSVEAICRQPDCEINIRGEFGQVPIHYCAMKDNFEAAKKLIEFSPLLCMSDNNGVYPIHCAATHASRRVLDILLTEAEKCGYERWQLLSFTDKEKNTALHSAVNGGCETAVQVCLEFGAKLDVQQDNKCTPLHLACGQGALRIVEIMLSNYKTENTLEMRDIEMMTPLHKAAMFDHVDVVRYLLDQGADIDAEDLENRTPLLLAASKRAWRSARLLLQKGANFFVKDAECRNVLHIAIIHGGNIRELRVFTDTQDTFASLLNERDSHGCTPMHYATQRGNIVCVESLIDLGATVNLKNNSKQSPLHFAARYGRLNSIKRLLDSKIGPNIINDTDGEGMTALHIAALHGHQKVVQLLLLRGALLHKDYKGRTPFHLAAMGGYKETMDILYSTHGHLLDQSDDCGNAPILLAAQEGQVNAVTYLLDHGAAVDIVNCAGDGIMDIVFDTHNKDVAVAIVLHNRWDELLMCTLADNNPIDRLIQHMPDVFMRVLDKCQTVSDLEPGHPEYWRRYDFKYLQLPVKCRRQWLKKYGEYHPLCTLNSMVKYNRVELLSHPVSTKFLDMKWKAYGALMHTLYTSIYLVFLAILTSFVCTTDPKPQHSNLTSFNKTDLHMKRNETTDLQYICVIIIVLYCGLNILKEFVQISQQKWRYFIDPTNYMEWALYVTAAMFVGPFLIRDDTPSYHSQWVFGAFAIFFAWFNLLLYQQKLGNIGIYVVMFLHILKTLVRVMFVFMILVVAFGMSFYILMKQETNNAFEKPHYAVIRVLTMMMGELDYINSFVLPIYDDDDYTQHYPEFSLIFLLALCVLLPILLMNLLIGLAVGDIAAVQRDAQLKRLAMQVEQYTDVENRLPLRFIERVDKDFVLIYPNQQLGWMLKNCMHLVTTLSAEEEEALRSSDSEFNPRHMHGEVSKLKRRLKNMSMMMDKQYELMRLVVQKMEIRSEADEKDEGTCEEAFMMRPRSARLNLSQVVRLANAKGKASPRRQIPLKPDSAGRNSRPGSAGRRSPASVISNISSRGSPSPTKMILPAEPSF